MNDLNLKLLHAVGENDLEQVKDLIAQGAEVNAWLRYNDIKNYWAGDTPLKVACRIGSLEGVKLLVDLGADINFVDAYLGDTALMEACFRGHLTCVRFLVGHGADINLCNYTGNTALINSIYPEDHDKVPVIDFLLKNNADPSIKDNNDQTVFDHLNRLSGKNEMASVVQYFKRYEEQLSLLSVVSKEINQNESQMMIF